ncbi:DNA alkylation repair protein [Streptomyces sp. NPDC048002]|uniref:DNA alkylation repair protein n=1 Tax=Streptomyces sp. NPDC048002 TaxID=3154344 RepID=UPI0033ED93C4
MPTADELISADEIHRLAGLLRRHAPGTSSWDAVAESATALGTLSVSERARAVGEALLSDCDRDHARLAQAVRAALTDPGLTGWMVWPLTEAVAVAATGDGGDEPFDDGLDLLARLTPRLTAEFALRTFLNADLDRTLAAAHRWTASPDPAVRRLASEGTRPRLPWARQVPSINRDPSVTVPLLDALHTDASDDVRRSVANHLNDISRLDAPLATSAAARWLRGPDPTTPALVRHALRTLVKAGEPVALELVGFHGGRDDVKVVGPVLTQTRIPMGGTLSFSAHLTNVSAAPVSLAVDYVVHHMKANGRTAPKVFKLARRDLTPGESTEVTRTHSFRPLTTRVYHPGTHAVQLQVNGHRFDLVEFTLGPASEATGS